MKKKWTNHEIPNVKSGGIMRYSNTENIKGDVIVSITYGEGLNLIRIIPFMILTQLMKNKLTKRKDLLYAEISGQFEGGIGQTLTVWEKGKSMASFRNKGLHKLAMRYFNWTLTGKNIHSYFLTYKTSRIPDRNEAKELVILYGNHIHMRNTVKKATKPPMSI